MLKNIWSCFKNFCVYFSFALLSTEKNHLFLKIISLTPGFIMMICLHKVTRSVFHHSHEICLILLRLNSNCLSSFCFFFVCLDSDFFIQIFSYLLVSFLLKWNRKHKSADVSEWENLSTVINVPLRLSSPAHGKCK